MKFREGEKRERGDISILKQSYVKKKKKFQTMNFHFIKKNKSFCLKLFFFKFNWSTQLKKKRSASLSWWFLCIHWEFNMHGFLLYFICSNKPLLKQKLIWGLFAVRLGGAWELSGMCGSSLNWAAPEWLRMVPGSGFHLAAGMPREGAELASPARDWTRAGGFQQKTRQKTSGRSSTTWS